MRKIIVKWKKILIFLFFLSFLVFLTVSLSAQAEEGIVIAVYDGDTIKVRFNKGSTEVVRLIGINSPELKDSREKVRFLALMAKRFSYRKSGISAVQQIKTKG